MSTPKLSIIVIVYDMPRQAMNTLYTLTPNYQQNVGADDYEVVVIENESKNNLDPSAIGALGGNIHYQRRNESGVSPAAAINVGFALCRAPFIGLMIDGARMLSPRVIENALIANAISKQSLTAIPSYNFGTKPQHQFEETDYSEDVEVQLLEKSKWKNNGYRLFDISSIGEANPRGVFQPFMESNCYFTSYDQFAEIGFADESFHYPGGGGLNLHMFRALGMLKQTNYYIVVPGEGTFHQFHGGVSTAPRNDREAFFVPPRDQLESHWGGKFNALEREPLLLGAVAHNAQANLLYSSMRAKKRFARHQEQALTFWADDLAFDRYVEQAN